MPATAVSKPRDIIKPLFDKAKATDEFEFASALLRIRGMEDAYWDPLQETYQLTRQLIGLINAPLENPLQLRLFLFLYCHVTEADDIVGIVANLLLITAGERYSFIPFESLPKPASKLPRGHRLNARIEQLVALANAKGFPEIATLFESLFVRPVRNAYFHSDYVLSPDSFNIRHGEGVEIEHCIEMRIPFDWLMPRLHLGELAPFDWTEYPRR